MKGIEMLSNVALFADDLNKATKASKKAYRIQQQSTGSSKGAGITLELKDDSDDSSSLDIETKILSSDDEQDDYEKDDVREKQVTDEKAHKEEHANDQETVDDKDETADT
ncbi:hypothetical protein Tco_1128990 [Tanacetum coccineum]